MMLPVTVSSTSGSADRITITPKQVGVTVNLENEILRESIPVEVSVVGTPADGYELESVLVIPESVAFMKGLGIVRWANTTASSEGVTLGILHVALRDPEQTFSERELRMYRLGADIVGPAMAHLRENARRAREEEDRRRQEQARTAPAPQAAR